MALENEAPVCIEEDHGLMIPCETLFAYVPNGDGIAYAFIEYDKPGDVMVDYVWAPKNALLAGLLRAGQTALGLRIQELRDKGILATTTAMHKKIEDFLRIDDRREGHGWTYYVWTSPKVLSGIRPLYGRVYHFYPDDGAHTHPRLEELDAVLALSSVPDALVITNVDGLKRGTELDDPEIKARWDLENRVVVWDLGAIHRAGSNA